MTDGSYPTFWTHHPFKAIAHPKVTLGDDQLREICHKAFDQSLFNKGSRAWYGYPSVQASLQYQLSYLGDVQRKYGNISFLTHLMEVTDSVFNDPLLIHFAPEYRAIVPVNHDLEDVCKKEGLSPLFVIAQTLSFLPQECDFTSQAETSLFLLMDPPRISDEAREYRQIERAHELDLVATRTRYHDKMCTYRRDLHNMRTLNPETGKPFKFFANEQEAEVYRKKLDQKEAVIFSLFLEPADLRAWVQLQREIDREINHQLMGAPACAQRRDTQIVPQSKQAKLDTTYHFG